MNKQQCLDYQCQGKQVYYKNKWWDLRQLNYFSGKKAFAFLVQLDDRGESTSIGGWASTDELYSNPCEQCDAPADGLDQIHCQEHWEQVCSDAYYEQIFP